MRDEYDFTNSIKNPYKKTERKKVTLQIDSDAIAYFKDEADRTGIPYQTIINFYLVDCAREKKHLAFA
jgi:predicted DNA binding CopG/RHH family protein